MNGAGDRTKPDAELLRTLLAEQAAAAAADDGGEGGGGEYVAAGAPVAGADPGAADELVAYLRGELGAEAEARVRRRLLADPAAARALLDLADLEAAAAQVEAMQVEAMQVEATASPGADDRPVPPTDLAAAVGWRELRRRLRRLSSRSAWKPLLATVAAASLLICVGLGVRLYRVEQRLAGHGGAPVERPVVNLAGLDLTGGSRGAAPPVVEVAPGDPLWLAVTPPRRCPVYRAAVEGGGEARTLDGLRRDARGSLNLLLYLDPGLYELHLYGCEPEERVDEHRFRVAAPGGRAP
jgi:hypothetical protein